MKRSLREKKNQFKVPKVVVEVDSNGNVSDETKEEHIDPWAVNTKETDDGPEWKGQCFIFSQNTSLNI